MKNLPQIVKNPFAELVQAICQGVTIMPHSISIYIPSTSNVSEKIDNQSQVKRTVEFFARIFNGVSIESKLGVWPSKTGEIIEEKITAVCSFTDDANFKSCFGLVMSYAMSVKVDMGQEKLALVVDGKMILI